MVNRTDDHNMKIVQSIAPDIYTTNNTTLGGSAVDLQGYDAATAFLSIKNWNDSTTGGLEIGLQESNDTTGAWSDVADADLSVTVAGATSVSGAQSSGIFAIIDNTAEDNVVLTTAYKGNARYLRAFITAEEEQATGYEAEVGIILTQPNQAKTGANRA